MSQIKKQNSTPSPVVESAGSLRGPASSPHFLWEGEKKGGGGPAKGELISIAFQLGFIIAIPVIAFGFAGKWMDQKLDSSPLLTLIGIFTAIVFTSIWIYRKFKNYFNSTPSSSPPSPGSRASLRYPASHGGEKREGDDLNS